MFHITIYQGNKNWKQNVVSLHIYKHGYILKGNKTKYWWGYATTAKYNIGGNVKWYNHFGKIFGSSYKVKQTPNLWPNNSNFIARELKSYVHEKICTRLLTAVLFAVTHNWKYHKCLSIRKMDKRDVVYTYIRILFSHEKEEDSDKGCNMDESGVHYTQWD